MTKQALRAQAKARRDAIPRGQREKLSAAICERLLASPDYASAETILAYAAIQSEVSLRVFCERALSDKKALYFPRVEGREIVFYRVPALSALAPGSFSVPEPEVRGGALSRFSGGADAWLLAPGVAFSVEGARLGYGGGFYDRFLAAHAVHATGIAFEIQLLSQLMSEPHDRFVDDVATEKNWYRERKESCRH